MKPTSQHRSRPVAGTLATVVALALVLGLACGQTKLGQVLPAGARIDVFPQISRAQLDAIFVVDNSRYMGVHQKRVADSFGRFLSWLDKNQIDYHLGLLSADTTNSPGVYQGGGSDGYFSGAEVQGLPAAVQALGGAGSAISPVLSQTLLAIQGPPPGFLRPAASLFLVAVTDNNDPWSSGTNDYYYRALKAAKGTGNDGLVSLSVLAGDVPGGCTLPDPQNPANSFVADPAPRLKDLAERTGGRFKSLCAPDFDAVFDELGATAAGLKKTFRLAKAPQPGTLQVVVKARCDTLPAALAFCAQVADQCGDADPWLVCTPRPQNAGPPVVDGWTFDESTLSIVFSGAALPPRASQVEVQYQEKVTP